VIENIVQLPFPDGVEHEAVLVAQLLLFLRIAETGLRNGSGVGDGFLADAAPANEDLGLKQFFAFARFTLHVVDGVDVFDVGIKAEDHKMNILETKIIEI